MSSIQIRPATHDDLDAITAIYAHSVLHGTATYELEPPSRAEMLARFNTLAGQGYPYLAVVRDGVVIGYAYAGPFRPRRAYRFMVEDSIYLAPEAQGQGVGRLLMEALIEQCRALGFRQIAAVIGDGKINLASIRLHERTGFRHAGVLEGSGYKFDRWLDTVFMQLTLNGGTTAAPDPGSLPERL